VPPDEERVYRFGPLERRGVVGGLRVGQVACLGGGCVLAVLALRAIPGSAGMLSGVLLALVAAGAALVPISGRTLDEWLPVVSGLLVLRSRGDHAYRAGRASAGTVARLDGSGSRSTSGTPRCLRGCRILAVRLGDGSEVGVFHDPELSAYTAVVAARARAVSLLPTTEHERRLERWGQLLASSARRGSAIRRVQVLERTAPADGEAVMRYFAEARDETLEDDASAVRSYGELVENATRVIQEHEVLLAVQVDARRAWARAARDSRRGGRDEQAGWTLVAELRAFLALLQRLEVTVVGLLDPQHLASALRTAFDPYAARRPSDGGVGPDALEVHWSSLRADGAWHRTYWISQWPRLPVGPVFLTPLLLGTQAVRSVSVVIEPVPPDRSRRAVEAAVTSDEADELRREAKGFRRTAARQRQQEATLRREDELAAGHEEIRFAGYVTVTARSRDDLLAACDDVEQAARQAWLELTPCWGEQDVAFVQAALPIGRGLRRPRALGGT
jgi:Putative type VII ESX secretion system translocon, EccE